MAEVYRVKSRKRQSKKLLLFYRIIFLFVVIWFIGSSLYSLILGHLVDTLVVENIVVAKKHPVTAFLIRDEVTISAPVTGRVINKVQAGERVGFEMPVFQVEGSTGTALQSGNSITVSAPIAGVVSYVSDGLEEIFRPNELQSLDKDKLEELNINYIDNTKQDMVEKGKRFCKIVNNLKGIQLYLEFPLNIFEKPLQKGGQLTLYFPDLNREVRGTIVDLKGVQNNAQVLLELPETWYSLLNQRKQKVEIVLEKKSGVVLPQKAIVTKDNEELGVYWIRKGFVFWQQVEIISEDGENILVDGLEQFTEVVLNPGLVKEGQHLR
ncbi:MAG: HlyD family efflux transporter periplasmic adaptor subunit [Peptococcales bacterium]|jgi:putative membrane fusion protein